MKMKMSKYKYKSAIKKKMLEFALFDLNEAKSSHSKSWFLSSSSFKTANYLKDERFSRLESQLLFKFRTQTLNVKMNFPNMYEDKLCQTCKLFLESQSHLL